MVQRIAIYQGEGTIAVSLEGEKLTSKELIESDWDQRASLLLMPGGRDRPYHAALKGKGNEKIRSFVENGGTYLGICAGAYYGCRRIEFEKESPLEICEERELCFFSGTAIGPAFGNGTYENGSRKGARAASLLTPIGSFHAYYNGGCTFSGDFFSCRILARYLDLPDYPPAILERPIGKGRAILSGVHFEISASTLDLQDPYHQKIHPPLLASEPLRQKFWNFLSLS